MTDRDERRLHDYLDGRLDPAERADLERRLHDDPDLARQARALAEIRAALREEPPVPSAGFYARARQAFESKQRAPAGFRAISWEAAGLAAAAVLAAALFLPHLLRDESPRETREVPQLPAAPPEQDVSAPANAGAAGAAGSSLESSVEEPAKRADEPDDREARASEPSSAGKDEAAFTAAPEIGKVQAEMPAPRDEAEAYAPVPDDRDAGRRTMSKTAHPAAPSAGLAAPLRVEGEIAAEPADLPHTSSPVVALPPGIVGAGSIRTIEEREAWESLVFGEDRSLVVLGPFDPRRRIVLIGGRLDCSTLRAIPTPEAWEIRAEGIAHAEDVPVGGCAWTLPRDGRVLRVVGGR